ncbi:hypothetical protein C7H19_00555 [Aphanothece hegewaldii CCALA 016]|uniref:Uncharacterized protein n=1 Tax=Aphanothece hegewaldii CCALA 016 TaxID=2107694 RepID=A0A2T1M393_9CHRO|nr:hypothetical protein [Aphanothece hegewaldii]PSF39313.1 hypothetical protein C7H19_00555 [Aphanothece hegewaldii CCALA 016]
MRRRSFSPPATEVELFPFLSVLACTIGTLILLIIVLTTQLLGEQQAITIIAKSETGENAAKTPRYLECRQDGIVIYPEEKFIPKQYLNISDTLLELLLTIKQNRDKEYLIVAIRPDGIETFQEVRGLIEKQGIDIGYEPIDQNWKIKIETEKDEKTKPKK